MSATIRRATEADAVALGALHMACWGEAYSALLSPEFLSKATPESSAERWSRTIPQLESDGGLLLLAVHEDELVGFASAGPGRGDEPPRPIELYAIYVRASVYGTGIGQRLLDAAIGSDPAFLWVLEQNQRARAFYERNGFSEDGTSEVLPRFENLVETRLVR